MVLSDMGFFVFDGKRRGMLYACFFVYMMVGLAAANVVLIGRNVSLSFADMEANFAPSIKGSGVNGVLYVAEPLDACASLTSAVPEGSNSPFLLVIRGGCTFEAKIRNAQHTGYKAIVVYDNEYNGGLVSMSGNSVGIRIPAVFVSRASGETLKKYAGHIDVEFWIIPTFENSVWSIMAISFISLLAMAAVLATCFFIRRHRIHREQPGTSNIRQFHGMSSQLVKAMPSLIFTSVLEDNSTSATCAICLEDYIVGEKLRILPCRHKFHAFCVDSWLTSWRTFCPVCKQDARTGMVNPPASECTPLLSSIAASPSSSARFASFHSSVVGSPPIRIAPIPPRSQSSSRLSSAAASPSSIAGITSFRSSVAASPPIRIVPMPPRSQSNSQLSSAAASPSSIAGITSFRSFVAASPPIRIAPLPPRSQSNSRLYSLTNTHIPNSNRPCSQSPAINISRSSVDLRNASSHRTQSHLISPRSKAFPMSSSINSRYESPYISSPGGNGSPSYLAASSSRQSFLRHCSGASLSAMASDQSLPGC